MTDQELIAKLNSLKKLGPDKNWLESNRALLLSQISNSGAVDLPAWKIFLIDFSSSMKAISQPAYALGIFVMLLLSGSLFSQQILAKAKPNDSLYIARVISEKVKINTTFNPEERDKLAVQFASEHAQDISAVLADPAFNTEANKDQVAKLNDSFKQEVNTVKNHIGRLAAAPKVAPASAVAGTNTDDVMIAENSKDEQGIKLMEKSDIALAPDVKETTGTIKSLVEKASVKDEATSTDKTTVDEGATTSLEKASSTPDAAINNPSAADKILDEATQLFNQKDYTKAVDKLKEVDEIIK